MDRPARFGEDGFKLRYRDLSWASHGRCLSLCDVLRDVCGIRQIPADVGWYVYISGRSAAGNQLVAVCYRIDERWIAIRGRPRRFAS